MQENTAAHCFNPADRAFHENLVWSADGLFLVGRDGFTIEARQVVVIEPSGQLDVQGKPVYLGDVVRSSVEGGHVDFVVRRGHYLDAQESAQEGWYLHPYAQVVDGQEQPASGGNLQVERVSALVIVDNIYRNLGSYVPENTPYCYRILGQAEGGGLKVRVCPFWQYSAHGMVSCSVAGTASVDNSEDAYRLALEHLGSAEKVAELDTSLLLWDQCKDCGISEESAEE